MLGGGSGDPFASVAAALLRSGMRDVVAMAYSLYVNGAQQFPPAFYRRLFEEGNIAAAVRAGRQHMWQHDKRICVLGEFPLQDWLLPVLYQQDPLNFSFAASARKDFVPRASRLPEELRKEKNPYGFVGRDSAILGMERALRRPPRRNSHPGTGWGRQDYLGPRFSAVARFHGRFGGGLFLARISRNTQC
jgi:CHAT domain